MGRRCALLVLLALVSPAVEQASRDAPRAGGHGRGPRRQGVLGERESIRGPPSLGGAWSRVRAGRDADPLRRGSVPWTPRWRRMAAVRSSSRAAGACESSRSTPEAGSGRRASCRAAVRPTSPRRRWRAVAPRSSSGSGTRARGAGASRLPCATLERRAFGAPQPLSAVRAARRAVRSVSVAIGDRGDAVAAWRSTSDPALWTALRRPGESFRPAQRLAEDSSDDPKVAVGGGWNGGGALQPATRAAARRRRAATAASRARRRVRRRRTGPQPRRRGDDRRDGGHRIRPRASSRGSIPPGARVRTRVGGRTGSAADRHRANSALRWLRSDLAVAADDGGRAIVAWSEPRVGGARVPRASPRPCGRPRRERRSARASRWDRRGAPAEPKLVRLVPGGGALVAWTGPIASTRARAATAVTRLP